MLIVPGFTTGAVSEFLSGLPRLGPLFRRLIGAVRMYRRKPLVLIVATVMSNLGLEMALKEMGLGLVRAPVGDRYVVEEMRKGGYNLGGEQSGHRQGGPEKPEVPQESREQQAPEEHLLVSRASLWAPIAFHIAFICVSSLADTKTGRRWTPDERMN